MVELLRAVRRYLAWGALWLVATAVAGAVTWVAVSWPGHDEASAVAGVMTPAEVSRALAGAMTSAPDAGITGSSQPSSEAPPRERQPAVRTHNWQIPGGSVSVACRMERIQLLYASPASGWSYRLGTGTTRTLVIRFARPSATSTFKARCEHGAPFAVSATSSSPPSPPSPPQGSSGSQRDD